MIVRFANALMRFGLPVETSPHRILNAVQRMKLFNDLDLVSAQ